MDIIYGVLPYDRFGNQVFIRTQVNNCPSFIDGLDNTLYQLSVFNLCIFCKMKHQLMTLLPPRKSIMNSIGSWGQRPKRYNNMYSRKANMVYQQAAKLAVT